MHRTDTNTPLQAINGFLRGVGTHFLIDTDGTIYQCASLHKWTQHVGKIRSKAKETSTWNEKERQYIKSLGNDVQALHNYEKTKQYPNRYPINSDSIGIEVVGKHKNNQWEVVTQAQKDSINTLIEILKQEYSLTNNDIYEHDKISRKTEGEGANLYP
ncbi:MAG: N-acetylmuramoyl-L-alanine amidase [Helicobacter sp.]|nr:N-acetylmuramoyl-L-alanine amidase [Helicobacter sp.]